MREVTLLLFALTPLSVGLLILLYLRYRHSPTVLWRARVVDRREQLLRQKAERTASSFVSPVAQLADDLFARYLRTVPVSSLTTQPGIGPATVDKLESAGWKTIPDVRLNQLDTVPGLGTAKANEVRAAVRAVTADARARFEAGACPEGVEFRTRAAELKALEQTAASDHARQLAADADAIAKLDRLAEIAKDVSFWNSLFHAKVPGLTDDVLHAELPAVRFPSPLDPESSIQDPTPGPLASRRADSPTGRGGAEWSSANEQTTPTPPRRGGVAEGTQFPGGGGVPNSPAAEPPSVAKLRAVCRFGLLVAKADGRAAKAETAVLREHVGRVFASDPLALRFIDVEIENAQKATLNEADVITAVAAFPPDERKELVALASRMAAAAGAVSAKEQQLLARLQAALGEPEPTAADLRAVLEIPPDAELTPELIRRRYHLLSEKADPSKAAGLGAEFAAMAEKKRAELKAAAESLLAPLGVPLVAPPPPPPPSDLRHNPDLDAVFGV
jgi:uncharacterized tellurite resistance protein B-like protein